MLSDFIRNRTPSLLGSCFWWFLLTMLKCVADVAALIQYPKGAQLTCTLHHFTAIYKAKPTLDHLVSMQLSLQAFQSLLTFSHPHLGSRLIQRCFITMSLWGMARSHWPHCHGFCLPIILERASTLARVKVLFCVRTAHGIGKTNLVLTWTEKQRKQQGNIKSSKPENPLKFSSSNFLLL